MSPLTSHTLTVRGWGWGGVDEAGIIPEFRFHSAVIAGGGKGEGRWELWELREHKEQRGSLVVCVIAPKCIFLFLVIPFSVWPADDLILRTPPTLLSYSGEAEDNRTGTVEMIGGFAQYTTRNVIKNSQLIGFFHDKAQSSHT